MKRFSSTLIGVFVLGGLILGAIGVISFGTQAWWRDREYLVVYFKESVHGLDRGSSVKLMGVPVGRVAAINVAYVSQTGTVVQVLCEIDRSPFVRTTDGKDLRDQETLRRMVEDGLQARLDLIGITGMLYVELDFFREPREQAFALEHPKYVVVPSQPLALAGLVENLTDIAEELRTIDFAGIGESATRLLENANVILEETKVVELFARMHETVDGVNELLDSDALHRAIVSAGDSFEDLSRLARRLEAEVDPLSGTIVASSEELQLTLREMARTFADIQELVGPRMGLGTQLRETLTTMDEAARSVERLADFLERNPQAIMRGRADPW